MIQKATSDDSRILAEMLFACEKRASDMGCREFASDYELDNIAPDKEVFEISEMLLEKNKEAYEELAK